MVLAIGEPSVRLPPPSILCHEISILAAEFTHYECSAVFLCYNILNMNPTVILLVSALVALFHPFIFLWYGERQRNRKLVEIARLGLPPEKPSEVPETVKQELEAKERDIQAKELALSLANKRLDKLDRAKFEFVSVTTHQLRTPLSAIKWTFHMLVTGQLGAITDEQKVFLQKGYESTDRAINIVNELLKIDSIQEGKDTRAEYNFGNTDLVELLDNVAFLFAKQMKEKQIDFGLVKPTHSVVAEVDAHRLHIVFENLFDNAVKYTKSGGKVTVTLSDAKLNSARSAVEISFSDTGIGVPEVEQSKIFQRFFRASNAVKLVTDGNGLGLAIVKDIIDNHQGEIRFESKEGVGTTFHLTIPLQQTKV